MTWSRRQFVATTIPLAAIAVTGLGAAADATAETLPAGAATTGTEQLTIVRQQELLATPPTETVLRQSVWTMHETGLSRSSLVRVDGPTPMASHAGRRMLIVLEGRLRIQFLDRQQEASGGAFVDIPAGAAYRLVPLGSQAPLVVGFEVPRIVLGDASTRPFGPEAASGAAEVSSRATLMARPTSWNDPSDRGWTLVRTDQLRVNLVEMFTALRNHLHPDADHSLILLSGAARVVTPSEEHRLDVGTYISIPAGVAHKYYVDSAEPALFVSFDAPAYNSANTIYLE